MILFAIEKIIFLIYRTCLAKRFMKQSSMASFLAHFLALPTLQLMEF